MKNSWKTHSFPPTCWSICFPFPSGFWLLAAQLQLEVSKIWNPLKRVKFSRFFRPSTNCTQAIWTSQGYEHSKLLEYYAKTHSIKKEQTPNKQRKLTRKEKKSLKMICKSSLGYRSKWRLKRCEKARDLETDLKLACAREGRDQDGEEAPFFLNECRVQLCSLKYILLNLLWG